MAANSRNGQMNEEVKAALDNIFARKTDEEINELCRKLYENHGIENLQELHLMEVDDLKGAGLTTVEAKLIHRDILQRQTNQQPVTEQTTNTAEIAALHAKLEIIYRNFVRERTASNDAINDLRQQVEQLRVDQETRLKEQPPPGAVRSWAQTAKDLVIPGLIVITGVITVVIIGLVVKVFRSADAAPSAADTASSAAVTASSAAVAAPSAALAAPSAAVAALSAAVAAPSAAVAAPSVEVTAPIINIAPIINNNIAAVTGAMPIDRPNEPPCRHRHPRHPKHHKHHCHSFDR